MGNAMDHANDKDQDLDRVLRETYEGTTPPDSWQALRERIDTALTLHGQDRAWASRPVVFWRRTALALAACFVAALGLLIWVVSAGQQTGSLPTTESPGAPALLGQAQIERLVQAFSQVRGLFADHQPWLMIDSAGNSQMGLTPKRDVANATGDLIVLRLMVQEVGGQATDRYADLIAYPRQQITLTVPTAAGSTIELRLMPSLREGGGVDVEFMARDDSGSRTGRVIPVGRNAFTPLAQIQIGVHGFRVGAMAKPVPLSEQG
jgi:hypothetical protein